MFRTTAIALALAALASAASAQPLSLDNTQLDRVTAGGIPSFDVPAGIGTAVLAIPGNPIFGPAPPPISQSNPVFGGNPANALIGLLFQQPG